MNDPKNDQMTASQSVLITGASSGIGAAAAKRFGVSGAHVVALARNEERLAQVADTIRKAGGTASAFAVDLRDTSATLAVTETIAAKIGTPDLIVNNAGAGQWLPLLKTSPDQAAAMMDVPYLAAFNITRAFAPAMIERGSGGIGFVTSPASYLAWPNASGYIAARRALAGFAESLQAELKPSGVSVTVVVLGSVDTPYWEHNPGSLENVPAANPFLLPTLTVEQAADAVFTALRDGKRFVIKPPIYRALFVMNALFPKTVASRMRRAAKKARKART